MYVYADVFLAINVVINSIILVVTAWFAAIDYKVWRILLAAAFGSIYALGGLAAAPTFLYGPLAKMVVSVVIVLLAFRLATIRALLVAVACFYIVSLLLGGAMVGWLFFFPPLGSWQSVSPGTLTAGAVTIYILAGLALRRLDARLARRRILYPLIITYNGHEIQVTALLDTGNQLYAAGHRPVVLVEARVLKPILSSAVNTYLEGNDPRHWVVNLAECPDLEWLGRIYLIPYRAVGGGSMLLGFRPDSLSIRTPALNIKTDALVIGLLSGEISAGGGYQALLHPAIVKSASGREEADICA